MTNDNAPVGILVKTVFESILEVFLLCCAGYILARKEILDKRTQKQLNRLNVSLFTPSLLFSKVAFFLSPAKLKELWVIPLFFVLVTIVSMAVAWVLSLIFRLKRTQRNFAMAASMFMNSNSLPIALMQSLVITVPGLKWDSGDTKNAMLGRALTYMVLYSTLGMVLRWSYGVHLLSQADDEGAVALQGPDAISPFLTISQTHLGHQEPPAMFAEPEESSESLISDHSSPEESPVPPPPPRKRPGLIERRETAPHMFWSFPNTPTHSRVDLTKTQPSPGEFSQDPLNKPLHPVIEYTKSTARTIWDFMTVPLWAALASILVACIQPLQHALDDHLPPVKGALTSAGNCSIPVTLVVLGAYFHSPDEDEPPHSLSPPNNRSQVSFISSILRWKSGSGRKRPYKGETKTVIVSVLSRMLITPLVLLPFVALSAKYDWHRVLEDPVFVVSNVLLLSSPVAVTLAQITQAASGDAFERLISRTIFWSYCVITPPATIAYVVIGLVLSKL